MKTERDELEKENKRLRLDLTEVRRNLDYQMNQNENLKNVMDGHGDALQNKIRELLRDIDQYKIRVQENDILKENLRQAEFYIKDCESRIQIVQHDKNKLEEEITEKKNEIKEWKEKFFNVEAKGGRIDNFEDKMRRYEEEISVMIDEVEVWKQKYYKIESVINNKESIESKVKEIKNFEAYL